MEIECDTLILSVGLIPYISLLDNIECPTSSTKGAKVNEHMETMIEGVFSCGNCLPGLAKDAGAKIIGETLCSVVGGKKF